MQPLDTAGANLLTAADGVAYGKGCEVLDAALNVVSDISGDLESGTVSRTMRATVHGTCSLSLARDVDYQSQLLRPYMTVTAAGVTAKFYLGAYVPRKPATTYGASLPSNQVDGSDRLFLLNRPVGNAYTVAPGTGILAAVRQAIIDAGFSGSTVLLDGSASDRVLPIAKVWPLIPDTDPSSAQTATAADAVTDGAANGTTWLQIVNELLAMVNYRGLWCDWLGVFRSEPYADPSSRAVEFPFTYADALRSVIARSRSVTQDLSTVPNVWIFQQQNTGTTYDSAPPEPAEGAGQYTVDEHADPSTPGYRGGLPWVVVIPLDAADQATLVAQGNARVAADKRVSKVLAVSTAPFPAAWHWDIYSYADEEMEATYKVQSTQWQLDLGGNAALADMTHAWEVVR